MTPTHENIHVATLIRLNVATTALQQASALISELLGQIANLEDARESADRAARLYSGPAWDASCERLAETVADRGRDITNALRVAQGFETEVSSTIRETSSSELLCDPARVTRYLALPTIAA